VAEYERIGCRPCA